MKSSEDQPGHDRWRTDLGAYALGGLPPDEATLLEDHLAGCPECRAELQDLQLPAAMLHELRAMTTGDSDAALAPSGPPADLGSKVLAAVTAEQARERRLRWLRSGALASVAGAAAAAVVVAGLALTGPDPALPVPSERVSVLVERPGVQAQAALVDHTWGVEVKLTGSGFAEGRRFTAAVISDDGRRHAAGEFVGTGDNSMLCNLSSSVLRAAATGFEVRDWKDRVVLRSTFA